MKNYGFWQKCKGLLGPADSSRENRNVITHKRIHFNASLVEKDFIKNRLAEGVDSYRIAHRDMQIDSEGVIFLGLIGAFLAFIDELNKDFASQRKHSSSENYFSLLMLSLPVLLFIVIRCIFDFLYNWQTRKDIKERLMNYMDKDTLSMIESGAEQQGNDSDLDEDDIGIILSGSYVFDKAYINHKNKLVIGKL